MFSQFLPSISSHSSNFCRFAKIAFCTTLGAIVTELSAGILPEALANVPNSATSTTKTALLKEFPRNQSATLGTVSTNLAAYRDDCSNPQDVSQITALCVALGVLTGQNPDGSVELDSLTSGSPIAPSSISPEDLTSAPKTFPLGLVSPEQNDKVQLFSSP